MLQNPISLFTVKIMSDRSYSRLYVTHESITGRVRKRIINLSGQDREAIIFGLREELTKHFNGSPANQSDIKHFVDHYISLKVNRTTSLFEYFDEFIHSKEEKTNKKTRKKIGNPTITSYKKSP
jgi:hypothetical protein